MAEQTQTGLTITQQKLAAIAPKFAALDRAGRELRELVLADDGTPSHSIRQAAAMETLRELLTPDVMAPIMALQGCVLGFKTDKDRDGGYPVDVIRDVTITALGRGGSMTRNRTNIIGANYYATKEQFEEWLDAKQGRGKWFAVHGIPVTVRGLKMVKNKSTGKYDQTEGIIGATVESEVHWLEGDTWRTEKLTHAIKGDEYTGADGFCGKADRKCAAWIYARITGEHVPTGDADEIVIPVQGSDRTAEQPPAASRMARKHRAEAAPTPDPAPEHMQPAPGFPTDTLVTEATAALKAVECPEGYALDYLTARGALQPGQTLKDAAERVLVEIRDRPRDLAKRVSAWRDEQDAAK